MDLLDVFTCEIVKNGKICRYQTDRSDNFDRHVREHHLRIKKTCTKCNSQFTSSSFARHIRRPCKPKAGTSRKSKYSVPTTPATTPFEPKSRVPTASASTSSEPTSRVPTPPASTYSEPTSHVPITLANTLSQPQYASPIGIVAVEEIMFEAKLQLLTLEDGTKTVVPFEENVNIDELLIKVTAVQAGTVESNTYPPQEQDFDQLIGNDVMLTPADSPVDGKMLKLYSK